MTLSPMDGCRRRTSPAFSMAVKRMGNDSQYLKQSRHPLHRSKVRSISGCRAERIQYFASFGL